MRIGSLVYATDQGLGVLSKAFYDHGIVTDVLVVRHSSRPSHREWYPNSPTTPHRVDPRTCREFVREMDVVLFFETPFDWSLIPFCREHGIRTVLMPMYECTPRHLPAVPDRFLCPSALDLRYFPPEQSEFIPVPVDVSWKERTGAETFVHNGGNLGLRGRNGTAELVESLQYIRSPLRLRIRTQKPLPPGYAGKVAAAQRRGLDVTLEAGTVAWGDLYREGDVFVFPEKFNGLSLPLQEACASGMLVMGADRFPMNSWLPNDPLIPVAGYHRANIGPAFLDFDEAEIHPQAIAQTLDSWYGRDIRQYSLQGKTWAEETSWDVLKPKYLEALSK